MLNENQYASSKKYEARIYLNKQFKTNPQSKFEWVFDYFPKEERLTVLELGCGTGLFWLANRNHIPRSWTITLSDYSEGMLEATRNTLSRINHTFQYEIVNAEDIQYPDNQFDLILANNMLYHVQDKDAAIRNICRILKDDGVFITSTMGKNDLRELHHHLYAYLESKGKHFRFREYSFSLDNGMERLTNHFNDVRLERYENTLVINEADAIVDYYLSFNEIYDDVVVLPEAERGEFKVYLQHILDNEKAITTTKDEGLFICRK
jgi:ubiquinone/menaquinone biosynthesis C-methylase UbiE